jgi:5-methylcytosine-specific restriction protein A
MPMRPPQACTKCHGSTTCVHQGQPRWKFRPPPKRTLVGRPLQRMRGKVFLKQLCCQQCGNRDLERYHQLDHIIPYEDGGTDDESNLQRLCIPCHRAKTADEARRFQGALR